MLKPEADPEQELAPWHFFSPKESACCPENRRKICANGRNPAAVKPENPGRALSRRLDPQSSSTARKKLSGTPKNAPEVRCCRRKEQEQQEMAAAQRR